MFEQRICAVCGKQYIPIRFSQKTCCHDCAAEYSRRMVNERNREKRESVGRPPVICAVCGKPFEAKSRRSRLCSPECRKVQASKNALRAKHAYREKAAAERIAATPLMERNVEDLPQNWKRKPEPVTEGVPLTTRQLELLQGKTGVSYGKLREMQDFGRIHAFCRERGITEL